jgi:hypothetical protein
LAVSLLFLLLLAVFFAGFCGAIGAIGTIQWAIDLPIQPIHLTAASQRYQHDFALVAWLKPDGGSGGDVEPHAASLFSIERQSGIHLKEMEVGANLNRAIARIGNHQLYGWSACIQLNLTRFNQQFAWNHLDLTTIKPSRHSTSTINLAKVWQKPGKKPGANMGWLTLTSEVLSEVL